MYIIVCVYIYILLAWHQILPLSQIRSSGKSRGKGYPSNRPVLTAHRYYSASPKKIEPRMHIQIFSGKLKRFSSVWLLAGCLRQIYDFIILCLYIYDNIYTFIIPNILVRHSPQLVINQPEHGTAHIPCSKSLN